MSQTEFNHNQKTIQVLVGRLMCISLCSKKDIKYPTQYITRITQYPCCQIIRIVKQIVAYLIKNQTLSAGNQKHSTDYGIKIYTDASHSAESYARVSFDSYLL